MSLSDYRDIDLELQSFYCVGLKRFLKTIVFFILQKYAPCQVKAPSK